MTPKYIFHITTAFNRCDLAPTTANSFTYDQAVHSTDKKTKNILCVLHINDYSIPKLAKNKLLLV